MAGVLIPVTTISKAKGGFLFRGAKKAKNTKEIKGFGPVFPSTRDSDRTKNKAAMDVHRRLQSGEGVSKRLVDVGNAKAAGREIARGARKRRGSIGLVTGGAVEMNRERLTGRSVSKASKKGIAAGIGASTAGGLLAAGLVGRARVGVKASRSLSATNAKLDKIKRGYDQVSKRTLGPTYRGTHGRYVSHASDLLIVDNARKSPIDSRLQVTKTRNDRSGGLAPIGARRTRSRAANGKIPNGNSRGHRLI